MARWPGFVPEAVAAGARAMFALPLQAGAIRVGVLSQYRARPGLLGGGELADVLAFADVALQLLVDASAGISGSAGLPAAELSLAAASEPGPRHAASTQADGPFPRVLRPDTLGQEARSSGSPRIAGSLRFALFLR